MNELDKLFDKLRRVPIEHVNTNIPLKPQGWTKEEWYIAEAARWPHGYRPPGSILKELRLKGDK